MSLLRVPLSSDWPCSGCGYPVRGLARSGACPECGLRVTASIVHAIQQERDERAVRLAIQAEWRRSRQKLVLLAIASGVWAVTLAAIGRSGGDALATGAIGALAAMLMTFATCGALGFSARLGFLTTASYLSLLPLSLVASVSAVAVATFFAHVGGREGIWLLGIPLGMVVFVRMVRADITLDSFNLVLVLVANTLSYALASFLAG